MLYGDLLVVVFSWVEVGVEWIYFVDFDVVFG